ncbi:MAG: Crp/Fnr family transcriptional regulator [Fimbriimonadaceae bacterium]
MEGRHSCLWYLRNVGFFPQLTEPQMMDLAKRSEMREVPRKERIELGGLEKGRVYLIKEGRVRTLEPINKERSVGTDVLGPGDMIGIADLIAGEGDTECFEAVEDSLICIVDAGVLHEILRQSPDLTLHIAKRVGIRMRRIETRLLDLIFCTVPVRVARTLLDLAERFGRPTREATLIDLALTHQQVADLVGSNREATTRALASLLDTGVIAYHGRKVLVRDLAALKRHAER